MLWCSKSTHSIWYLACPPTTRPHHSFSCLLIAHGASLPLKNIRAGWRTLTLWSLHSHRVWLVIAGIKNAQLLSMYHGKPAAFLLLHQVHSECLGDYTNGSIMQSNSTATEFNISRVTSTTVIELAGLRAALQLSIRKRHRNGASSAIPRLRFYRFAIRITPWTRRTACRRHKINLLSSSWERSCYCLSMVAKPL